MITSGICVGAKRDFLRGVHRPEDIYKVALYSPSATLNPFTADYLVEGEVKGSGYEKGGLILEGYTCDVDGTTGYLNWSKSPVWYNATISAAGALVYNATKKASIIVLAFDELVTSTNGNWRLPMPAPTANSALVRFR